MLKIRQIEDVTLFKMGRDINGQVMYWTAAYLVGGILVDTGCAHTAAEMLDALNGRPVELIVNTHHHEDHVGANALLGRELGVPILAPAAAVGLTGKPYELYPYQEFIWGHPEPSKPGVLGIEVKGSALSLQVIPSPGHSLDHAAFFEPQKGWLFTGDAFIAARPKTARDDEDYAVILHSLHKLAALEPRLLFTGLGDVFDDGAAVLRGTIAYLNKTKSTVESLAAQGLEIGQAVQQMFGRESSLQQMTQGQMSYENFIRPFWRQGQIG